MRKLMAVLGCLFLTLTLADAVQASQNVAYQCHFRRNKAAVRGAFDSVAVNFSSAAGAGINETTAVISTENWDYDNPTAIAGTTSQPVARLWVFSLSTAIAGDSLYVAQDVSADGKNWSAGTLTGVASTTAGDFFVSVTLTTDSDAGGYNLWRAPFVRFRLQGDSGGVANANLEAKVLAPTWNIRGLH